MGPKNPSPPFISLCIVPIHTVPGPVPVTKEIWHDISKIRIEKTAAFIQGLSSDPLSVSHHSIWCKPAATVRTLRQLRESLGGEEMRLPVNIQQRTEVCQQPHELSHLGSQTPGSIWQRSLERPWARTTQETF